MHRRSKPSRGFTLLEILVVVVIIGILTAMMLPNLASSGRWRELNREAATLAVRIRVAQDDAMLQGREYGIVFSDEGYRFVAWDADKSRFTALPSDASWPVKKLDDGITLSASADDNEAILVVPDKKENDEEIASAEGVEKPDAEPVFEPSVFVLSSGEVTPFTAIFRAEGEEQQTALYVDSLGNRVDEKGELFDGRQP